MKKNLHLLITAIILLCFPKASFGQVPDLGRASGFTVFTSAGAITIDGASMVTGDVGNYVGAFALTSPAIINGSQFLQGSPQAFDAAADLLVAYDKISALPATVLGVTIVDATLTPGIYDTGAKATLNGTLTLDGQGDSSALFIIKIGGAFSTGSNAIVKLINGASMSNVFWQVHGAFALGDSSKFIGNVLADGAISLLEGSSLQGKALSIAGAIALHNVNASNAAPPCVPVSIGTQPSDTTLCTGTGNPSFTLIASGDGPFTYQWQYENAGVWSNVLDGIPTSAVYTNANTATLDISGITAAGNYSYQSILTNCSGANTVTSNTVTLTINPVPIITDQTTSITTGETFNVTPSGVPAGTKYTWPEPLYTGGVYGGSEQPNPQTTISQILSILSGTGTATYIVTPLSGSCNGNPFNVTVNVSASCVPVSIDTQPSDTTLCTGTGNPSFTLIASGDGPFTYQWQYLDAGVWNNVVDGTPTNALYATANTATLGISGITVAGSYSYQSILTNCSGTNTVTSNTVTLTINPITGNPVFIAGDTTLCQDSPDETYLATATNSTLIVYSVTPVAAGIIDASTGVMNWDAAFSGPATVRATATGPCTTTFTDLLVTINPSIGTPVFTSGDTILCQDSPDETYLATATNSTSMAYSVIPVSAGIIDASTGVMNWDAAFSGQATVTATATGLCGTTSTDLLVTINPSIGNPVFTSGDTILCQDSPDETYLATATNSTSMAYSVIPVSAGIIDASTGVMNWDAAFSGQATVTATATGLCGTTSTDLSVTINPLPLAAGVITGPESVCQTATGKVYSVALITNATDYIWTLPAGATIASGANTNSITVDFSATAVSGNITVQGSNDCGVGTVSPPLAIIVKITLVALAGSNSPVCEGSSINLTALTQPGAVYLWTGPNGFASNVQNPVLPNATSAQAGDYTLVVVTSCYCCYSAPSTVTVVVNNCNVSDLSITMTVDNIHPFMGRNVEFAVTATNQGPDKATGVSVSDLLPDGYTYVSSTTSVSSYDSNTGFWDIGTLNQGESELMTIIATANSTGNYTNTATVTGIEADGDLTNNVASVTTIPTDWFIPDAFSPNGDGINDLFVIRGIQNYPENKIVIYNRWGNKVFEASPYLNNWDGQATTGLRINGNDLPTGTYFYLLDLGDGTDMIKGTIYLNQ